MQKMVFTIVSRDQGLNFDGEAVGVTWFVALLVKATEPNELGHGHVLRPFVPLTRNLPADPVPHAHVCIWSRIDSREDTSKFVKSAGLGDVIEVLPLATCPGWVNYVMAIRIEIFSTCLLPHDKIV